MSTNLKNYIIETKNNVKYLIKAEIYTITEKGILTFQTDTKSVASYDAGTWLNCYELTEPSIIYLYSNDVQPYHKETYQEIIQEQETINPLNSFNYEKKDNSNIVIKTIETNEVLHQKEELDSNLNNSEADTQNVLSFLHKENEENLSTSNVRERVIEQLNNIYLTPSERKLKEKQQEEDSIVDFYKDIGREPLPASNNFEEDNIENTAEENEEVVEKPSSTLDIDNHDYAPETETTPENNVNSLDEINENEISEEHLLETLLQPNEKQSLNKDVNYFDEDPMSALLSTDFTVKNIDNNDPLAALDEIIDNQNDNDDPLAALDEIVDNQNDNDDPLAALDEMVDNQNDNDDPLAALDEIVDNQNNNDDPLAALDEMVDNQNDNDDSLAALDEMVDNQNNNDDPLAALDEMVDNQNDHDDPLAALDEMVDNQSLKTKEYETSENFDKDEHIDDEDEFEENNEADVYYETNKSETLDELLSKLPNEDNKFEASYHDSSREIRRVPSSQKDLDTLTSLIDSKSKKNKEIPSSEFRDTPEAIEAKKPVESYQLRNSQGRLLTPQELKIKKEKIIEQTVFQYCSKFPKFNSKHLSEILSKNPKAIAYKIVEDDIIWVASKMIRASSIQAKFFIRENEQKKLSHFLPNIIGKHWDGSISNLSSIIKDIPQLSTCNLMDLSVWLLENSHI